MTELLSTFYWVLLLCKEDGGQEIANGVVIGVNLASVGIGVPTSMQLSLVVGVVGGSDWEEETIECF